MLNQIVVVGRLVKDPVINETQDGRKLSNITLAVQRSFKNIEGNYETDFIDCVLWKGIAESTANYCTKGSIIGIKGRLMTSNFKNSEGNSVKNVEVVAEKVSFLGYPTRDKPKDFE